MGDIFSSCKGSGEDEVTKPKAFANVKNTNLTFQYRKGECVLEYWEPIKLLGEGSISSIHLIRRRKKRVSIPYKERADVMEYSKKKIKLKPGEKIYALKGILKDRDEDDSFLDEMRTEIEAMSRLDHPNIANVYEAYERKRHIYLVMEYCSGGDLYERAPYTEAQAARITRQILSAVAHMHKYKVVHRDLKMDNIMFENKEPDAVIKVIDFGLATKYLSDEYRVMRDRVGTVYTMAPQVLEGVYTSQCDIWSVGVITYMLLCGERPFNGRSRGSMVDKIMRCDLRFDAPVWDTISDEGQFFVSCLLKMNPRLRPTATNALKFEWLQKNGFPDKSKVLMRSDPNVFKAMIEYSKETKLKKVALMLIVHHLKINECSRLLDIFNAQDRNGDGQIDLKEFRKAVVDTGLDQDDIDKLFKEIDVREDGYIGFTEFLASAISSCLNIETERINEAFDALDVDHSGYISEENLRQAMGKRFSPEFLKDTLDAVDTDKDGYISREEFMNLFKSKMKEKEENKVFA
eukprot:CAMPEP_0172488816 /NCGR_PEP_ID=MMETSP1066-20121228/18538_1 /TAXON_ID=671091 /ORGANISM="Coscinodiscus wailesii, Strain CCMP2513" /LENGTH=517 /DNA_ID=CAMNT_0013256285 /DNA_START=71 /DNA_END=1624 /DNA_ORIENTATION=+